ncbi:MAG: hypothetical protein KF716_24240 [Anaerolineae bacterium]|nr:hypothetical protein [Anaerolineae bacterium]
MIRNLVRLMIVAAVALAALPLTPTHAEGFASDATYTIPELGIQFNYPSDWTFTEVEGGVTISESQADVAPQLDDDPETIPEGYVITVLHFDGFKADMTLDSVVDNVLEQLNFDELTREEVAIVSHRTIMVGGLSSRGRQVMGNFMLVNGTLYQFAVSGPADDDKIGTIWEEFMISFKPANAAPLGDTFQGPLSKLTLQQPEGWTTGDNFPNTYFENADDLKNPSQPKGVIVSLIEMDVTGMNMDTANVLELAYQTQGWDKTQILAAEHVVADQAAFVVKGESKSAPGFYGIIAALKVGDTAVLVAAVAPSEAQLAAFEPTFYAMLMSATVE